MKAQDLRDIAARLNRWADELDGIKTDGGAIKVKLPPPDLFSMLERGEIERFEIKSPAAPDELQTIIIDGGKEQPYEPEAPAKRVYKRVGCKMRDEAIVAANKVGRAQGYCQRSDIERSLRRANPERSREEIREAVNAAVEALGLTCVVFHSYRYYRRADRQRIMDTATSVLKPL